MPIEKILLLLSTFIRVPFIFVFTFVFINTMLLLPLNLKNVSKRIKTVKIIYKIYMINIRVP